MGLKFDAMFRLSMLGSIPLTRGGGSFVKTHPQFSKVTQDGTRIQSGSYAFPEVRKLVVSIIRETAENFDIDGINLCFIRGPGIHGLRAAGAGRLPQRVWAKTDERWVLMIRGCARFAVDI